MEDMAAHMIVMLGVLAVCFSGPALAVYLLIRRKRRVRLIRASPIGTRLLRGPGHSLREQLDEASFDLSSDLMLLMFVPLVALTMFLAQGHIRGLENMVRMAPFVAVPMLAFVVYVIRKSMKVGSRLDRLKAGYDAEVAIGQELDQLVRRGVRRIAHQIEQRCRTVAPRFAEDEKAA